MVRESILMLGALAALAIAEPPPLRLNPMSSATPEQLRILGRAPTPFELNWGIFVEWSEIPGGVFQLSVPEGFLTLRDRAFRFVCSQQWRPVGKGGWGFDEPLRFARRDPAHPYVAGKPYTIEPYQPYPARLRARVEPMTDRVELTFELVNLGKTPLDSELVWICFLHGFGGPRFDQLTVPGLSRDTFFRRGGVFEPWRPQQTRYGFMSAAGAALTERGWKRHRALQAKYGDALNISPHAPADGVRAATIQQGARTLSVALASEDAEVLGGPTGNPCTDLGLGLDPVAPGATGRVRATAWFVRGGLDELNQVLARAR